MYHLFLDDERMPSDVRWLQLPLVPWTIVRNYADFVGVITKNGMPATIAFDHDLGEEHYDQVKAFKHFLRVEAAYDYGKMACKTGYHCAKWLIEYCLDHDLDLPPCYVHSMSPIGGENIRKLLESYNRVRSSSSGVSVPEYSSWVLPAPPQQAQ